jgi:site-specific DNA-methyltransferase (adenine-specific)
MSGGEATGRKDGSKGLQNPHAGAGRGGGRHNDHPTVKNLALMRWLVRLVGVPGGIVLDPFMGSGSTGIAACAEGMHFLGIDEDPHYVEIARARLTHWGAVR